ncbi:MAG: hypothetical protein JKY24_07385 [Pseudomonadales bacterium]|nr:hypothetical protein [Pseudomonadales bacterium]
MAYLIILLVVAMMAGPIMWLRPSPRERHLMSLRTQAMGLGMSVTCPGVQRFKWASNNKLVEPKRFVRYTMPFDDDQLNADDFRGCSALASAGESNKNVGYKGIYFRWIYRGVEEWQWHEIESNRFDKIPALISLFNDIKASDIGAVAIELSFKSCSIFWHEEGKEASVEKIKSFLEALGKIIILDIKARKG